MAKQMNRMTMAFAKAAVLANQNKMTTVLVRTALQQRQIAKPVR